MKADVKNTVCALRRIACDRGSGLHHRGHGIVVIVALQKLMHISFIDAGVIAADDERGGELIRGLLYAAVKILRVAGIDDAGQLLRRALIAASILCFRA